MKPNLRTDDIETARDGESMKAFRWYGEPGRLKLEDTPIPSVGQNDVLVRVKAAGICGSDLHFKHARVKVDPHSLLAHRLPWTLGHEIAGLVDKVGTNVKGLAEGDRVSVNYKLSDGNCKYCNRGLDNLCVNGGALGGGGGDGGYAEYVLVPARNALILPKEIPMDQGAIVACAVATSYHAVKIAGRINPGDSVAVLGVGGVGMHAVEWASVLGASKVMAVDIVEDKLRVARQFGATDTINARSEDPVKAILNMTNGEGVDIALDCAGVKAVSFERAVASTAKAGRTVVVANVFENVSFDVRSMLFKESMIVTSCDHTLDDHRRVMSLVASGKVDLAKSVTHKVPFEKINEGIDMLDEQKGNPIRIVAEM
jgi:propanol-preferring alcohol dehydrogenase